MDIKIVTFGILGGLGLFLYGMKVMSEGLQKIAGSRLRKILELLTKRTVFGVLAGAGVTAIVQSSSVTSVMLIGFVNAGLLSLKQAIGVILGANIGTTITAQIIAFKIHKFALPAIGLGVFLNFFMGRKFWKYAGEVLLGFGMVFFGLSVMKEVFIPLKNDPAFANLFVTFSKNPLLGVLAGMLLTMIIQSSSVTVGITMTLAGVGLLDFATAFAVVLGDNIGTTITAQLAALKSNRIAKQTAWAHTLFNVFGAGYMLILLQVNINGHPIFLEIVNWLTPGNAWAGVNLERHIANVHSLFNIFNCLLFLPLVGLLAFMVKKIVRGEEEIVEHGTKYLDVRMLNTPAIALGQVTKEIVRMTHIAHRMLDLSVSCSFPQKFSEKEEVINKVSRRENVINELEKDLVKFIVKLDQQSLSSEESSRTAAYLHAIHDLERIGDLAENICDLAKEQEEENVRFSEEALQDIRELKNIVLKAIHLAAEAVEKDSLETAGKVRKLEGEIDILEQKSRDGHIHRLNKGQCHPTAGVIFLDILSNLERAGDHANNLAKMIIRLAAKNGNGLS